MEVDNRDEQKTNISSAIGKLQRVVAIACIRSVVAGDVVAACTVKPPLLGAVVRASNIEPRRIGSKFVVITCSASVHQDTTFAITMRFCRLQYSLKPRWLHPELRLTCIVLELLCKAGKHRGKIRNELALRSANEHAFDVLLA